jgi:hypothetical protein
MDGSHTHGGDPDLKILVVAIMGILAIVVGPAIVGALSTIVLGLAVSLASVAAATIAIVAYKWKHPSQLPPIYYPKPMESPQSPKTGSHHYLTGAQIRAITEAARRGECTILHQHRAIECNGEHRP